MRRWKRGEARGIERQGSKASVERVDVVVVEVVVESRTQVSGQVVVSSRWVASSSESNRKRASLAVDGWWER